MSSTIYWFRNDLRLTDNPAFHRACETSRDMLPVYIVSPDETAQTDWGFERWGPLRRRFRDQALAGLRQALIEKGSDLLVIEDDPVEALVGLWRDTGADRLVCETIAAPEEVAQVEALQVSGLTVEERWQSSLLDPDNLPFTPHDLPTVFTPFRKAVQASGIHPPRPLPPPATLPPLPGAVPSAAHLWGGVAGPDRRSSFPFDTPDFDGAEAAALVHLRRYFSSSSAQSYKTTRDGLSGTAYSTKLSPWLATGALSARTVYDTIKAHENRHGCSDGSEWITFELLWRDYFRFSSLKHGARLFHHQGLSQRPRPAHDPQRFERWCKGQTGQAFIDAGMRELEATGFLSNRLRQVAASYLIHDLECDWRAGAAWFEARLIDFDVCSNQGNWLYIGGRGADPRGGRRFDPEQQAAYHDPEGAYRRLWSTG